MVDWHPQELGYYFDYSDQRLLSVSLRSEQEARSTGHSGHCLYSRSERGRQEFVVEEHHPHQAEHLTQEVLCE